MKKITTTIIFSLLIILSTQAQEKVLLRLKPEIGKAVGLEMIMKSDIEGPQSMIMDMNMKMNMTALAANAEEIKYSCTYTGIKMDVNAGIMTMSYDSDKEPENQMEEMLASQIKPLLENTMTITMTPQAKVVSVDFPNVSEQAFDQSSIENMSVALPEQAIAIGESWEAETAMGQFGIKGKTTNTFAEKTANGYKIDVIGKFTNDGGEEVGNVSGYYILDSTTLFTKEALVKTAIEIQGAKVISDVEIRQIQ